jgi:predicted nuclease of predicted toxin-antitoxin system
LEDSADLEIFQYARIHHFAIVTFDSDYLDLNSLFGVPPKIIFLNSGNLTTRSVSDLILNNNSEIQDYPESENDDIPELIKTQ